jgi:hypothetical protein
VLVRVLRELEDDFTHYKGYELVHSQVGRFAKGAGAGSTPNWLTSTKSWTRPQTW